MSIVMKTIEARSIGELEREVAKYPQMLCVSFTHVEGKYRASLVDRKLQKEEDED